MAATDVTKTTDQAQNQATQEARQDAARQDVARQDAQRRATGQTTQDAARQSADTSRRNAEQASRQNLDQARKVRAEYPQDSAGGNSKPTPTQDENDEIRAGLRHIDDKEDDGSGPEPRFGMRRLDAGPGSPGYETR